MDIETQDSLFLSKDEVKSPRGRSGHERASDNPEDEGKHLSTKANGNEPVVDKETIMKRLKEIPVEKLKEIMTNQIDLEVRLKHKELRLTEEEIAKCESQMIALRKFFEIPKEVKFDAEPTDFTKKYYDLLNKSLSVNYTTLQNTEQSIRHHSQGSEDPSREPVHSYRTRSTTSSLRPSGAFTQRQNVGCLYRRTDGVIVKLTCPDCLRSNFSSAQGFLNHSRIAHSKEYTSQDAAALKCGSILPDEEQDEEGLASLRSLSSKNLDPNCNLNVNEIYFNGLSQTLNTVHKNDTSAPSRTDSVPTISVQPDTVNASSSTTNDRSISPLEKPDATHHQVKEDSELMKKLIRKGVTSNEQEYNSLIEETTAPVINAHLFDDESEAAESDPDTDPRTRSRHRRSRSSTNIATQQSTAADNKRRSSSSAVSSHASTDSNPNPTSAIDGLPIDNSVGRRESEVSGNGAATVRSENDANVANVANVAAAAPTPKIKLKLRMPSEDSKRRKRS